LGFIMNDTKETLSLHCPYCNKETYVFQETPEFTFTEQYSTFGKINSRTSVWWAGTCRKCKKPMLVINSGINIYPVPQPSPSNERIPNKIRLDLDEAKLCFSVGAYRGCAVLARRAIQNACLEKGAPEGELVAQINSLFEMKTITKEVREWAKDVHWIGNDAAHVNKENVEADDAEDSLKLAESFLNILYVIPKISEERRIKRKKGKPPTGDDR
jgi:hypothetical protein